jgi:hypothetical protein
MSRKRGRTPTTIFDNGARTPRVARQLYLNLSTRKHFGDPRRTGGSDSYLNWLNEPIDSCPDPSLTITQFWRCFYGLRPDLQQAFPDVAGTNRRAFIEWAMTIGVHELNVAESFVPSQWTAGRHT